METAYQITIMAFAWREEENHDKPVSTIRGCTSPQFRRLQFCKMKTPEDKDGNGGLEFLTAVTMMSTVFWEVAR
jgi:hypothetical protein